MSGDANAHSARTAATARTREPTTAMESPPFSMRCVPSNGTEAPPDFPAKRSRSSNSWCGGTVGRILRWLGYVVIALAVVAAVIAAGIVVTSNREIAAQTSVVPPPPALGRGSVERGKHLYTAVSSCVVCHGADAGGGPFINDPSTAVLYAPNLT